MQQYIFQAVTGDQYSAAYDGDTLVSVHHWVNGRERAQDSDTNAEMIRWFLDTEYDEDSGQSRFLLIATYDLGDDEGSN